MIGTSRITAKRIADEERLAQSIGDILSTPIGSRVMRREYGSNLPLLIDQPMNGETVVDVFIATAEAIDRWEPEFELRRVEIVSARAGSMELRLTGDVASVTVGVGK
jgi:uncharacterized protein